MNLSADRSDRRAPWRRDRAEGGRARRCGRRSTPARAGDGDLFFGLRGERVDGGEFAPAAIEAGAWGAVVDSESCRRSGWRLGLRRRGPAGRPTGTCARAGGEPRGTRRRHHRLGRQDLGQGHRPGAAARRRPRQQREPQHRDRAAADGARGAAGDRGARARDGDARRRPDRRAGGDRRARGGGDHQRRPGPRRAARLGRGDRGGQGRGAGGAARRTASPSSRSRRASSSPTSPRRREGCSASGPEGTSRRVEKRTVEGVTEALVVDPGGTPGRSTSRSPRSTT